MPKKTSAKASQIRNAQAVLHAVGFGVRQSNEMAALVLLALLDLKPGQVWSEATAPLRGITPIIGFISDRYGISYAPNTRETIRDDAVKFFAEAGLLLRNPDDVSRPTTSGKTVYQVEPAALTLLRSYGSERWPAGLASYLKKSAAIRGEIRRQRTLARVPVTLPDGQKVTLSAGGQNPLIKAVVEEFCPRFTPGAAIAYIGDTETKFLHLETAYLEKLGITLAAAAKMPDVVAHDHRRNWLILIEAVTSAGPVDGKRRMELKELFRNSKAGLVFVTAFETRKVMQSFLSQISWETEVWVAEDADHLIHFNGERFLGPYADAMPGS
jgi:hypothetical protein